MEGSVASGSAPGSDTASPDTGSQVSDKGSTSESTPAKDAGGAKADLQAQLMELGDGDMDKIVTVKVNGETKKVPLKQALKWAQLGDSAYSKMQQVAQEKQQLQQLFTLAKDNPKEFFKLTGRNAREFAEKHLLEELEHDALSPEQKELRGHRAWRAEQERIAKEREDGEKQTKEKAEYSKLRVAMGTELAQAWEGSGLPEDPRFGAMIAQTMLREKSLGNDLSAKEAAAIVKQDFLSHVKAVFGKLDPQVLEESLGSDTLKKWRDHDVKRVTQPAAAKSGTPTSRPPGSGASTRKAKETKPMNEREWAEWYASR